MHGIRLDRELGAQVIKELRVLLSSLPVLVLLALPHLSLRDHRIHCVPTIETQGIIPLHIGDKQATYLTLYQRQGRHLVERSGGYINLSGDNRALLLLCEL